MGTDPIGIVAPTGPNSSASQVTKSAGIGRFAATPASESALNIVRQQSLQIGKSVDPDRADIKHLVSLIEDGPVHERVHRSTISCISYMRFLGHSYYPQIAANRRSMIGPSSSVWRFN